MADSFLEEALHDTTDASDHGEDDRNHYAYPDSVGHDSRGRMTEPTGSCGRCLDGWICEDHPDQPWGHGCGGAGMPCENENCAFSVLNTGVVCPSCRQAVGSIELETHRVISFTCKDCGYQWYAEQHRAARQRRQQH